LGASELQKNVIEHLAGVEDFEVAMATYRAACQRWPNATITLRQGARVIQDSGYGLSEGRSPPGGTSIPSKGA
jgi:hypothetical protein